ncbi:MAG TPA: hypothetical protein VIV12_05125 [Streptosporangiaceae bacterium]
MIHEAIDAAITLGIALAVWVLLLAATATAALYTLVVGAALAWLAVTRACAAALAAVQRAGVPEAGPEPQKTADGRAVPSWARTDTEEAA